MLQLVAHIDDLYRRQRQRYRARQPIGVAREPHSLAECYQGHPPALCGRVAFDARRCAAEDDHAAGDLSELSGDIASMVARRSIVLIRRLVLLVDNDEPEVW